MVDDGSHLCQLRCPVSGKDDSCWGETCEPVAAKEQFREKGNGTCPALRAEHIGASSVAALEVVSQIFTSVGFKTVDV